MEKSHSLTSSTSATIQAVQYKDGEKNTLSQRPRWPLLIVVLVLILGGAYVLVLASAPRLTATPLAPLVGVSTSKIQPSDKSNYIIVPKLNLKTAIVTGDTEAVLKQGAWHRFPDRGDPEKGGNFILAAHRFKLGLTPQQTAAKSPFYNINKLKIGDDISIRYNQKDYTYRVTRAYDVKPNQVSIEESTDKPRLTLYSCTLKGSFDGRSVIEAEPVM